MCFSKGHNPYFNRWFSAILVDEKNKVNEDCHNPYFNRWFSAIDVKLADAEIITVTILILIDGFLQFCYKIPSKFSRDKSQSLF